MSPGTILCKAGSSSNPWSTCRSPTHTNTQLAYGMVAAALPGIEKLWARPSALVLVIPRAEDGLLVSLCPCLTGSPSPSTRGPQGSSAGDEAERTHRGWAGGAGRVRQLPPRGLEPPGESAFTPYIVVLSELRVSQTSSF